MAISGPSGIHLLNGLYDANLDHQPVLATTGLEIGPALLAPLRATVVGGKGLLAAILRRER